MTPIPHTGLPQGTLDLLILETGYVRKQSAREVLRADQSAEVPAWSVWRKLSDVVAQVLERV